MPEKPTNLPTLQGADGARPAQALIREWRDMEIAAPAGTDEADEAEHFAETVRETADRAGCSFLFELPPVLLGECEHDIAGAKRVAAVLCPDETACNVIFVVLHAPDRRVAVLQATDVPERIVEFAFSFADVMRHLSPAHASYSASGGIIPLH